MNEATTVGPALVVRAALSPQVGTGHVMRTLALAEGASRAAYVLPGAPGGRLAERFAQSGIHVEVLGPDVDVGGADGGRPVAALGRVAGAAGATADRAGVERGSVRSRAGGVRADDQERRDAGSRRGLELIGQGRAPPGHEAEADRARARQLVGQVRAELAR